jgi:pyocin large subunit-like protein
MKHYGDHADDFPDVSSPLGYVQKAHAFLRHPPPGTLKRVRDNGDVVLYDPATETFGVMTADGTPGTLYIPSLVEHDYPRNLAYFEAQGHLPPP